MSTTKKILLYVTNDLTYDQRMQRIASALSESGYQVMLIGRRLPNSAELAFTDFDTHRFKCFFNKGPLFYLELNIRIFWHAIWNKMDATCAVDLDTIAGVTAAAQIKKVPVIFDAHEWFTEVPELIGRNRVRNIWKKIESIFVPKTKVRYTVNQSLADIFSKQFNLPFDIVRNVPMKIKSSKEMTQSNFKIILYQGALNKGRGIEASILAMRQLIGFELWLVGEGDLSDALRRLVDDENLTDRVKFLGYKTPVELKKITSKAFIGLNLLEGESQNYYFSLANKFFDYMQAGVPSLNMKFPEYERILSLYPCGGMIEACDPSLISSAILNWANDDSTYLNMVDSSSQASEIFNWDEEKRHLIKIWNQVCQSG